jgi:short-subunit dehydrogenase
MTNSAVVVVTGASSGIGEAVAYRLSTNRHASLLLLGRNSTRLKAVARKCEQKGATRVSTSYGDLRDRHFISAVSSECLSLAPISALVNCAGLGTFHSTDTMSDADWDQMIEVNLSASFFLCREVIKTMITTGNAGSIINVSSDADTIGFPHAAGYCASKGGVLAFSRALQEEVHLHGIRVSVLSPGRVDTSFNGKEPGMRPGALSADEVAEVIEFLIYCSRNIEVREIRIESLSRQPVDQASLVSERQHLR